jgi:hypothetical protein
MSNQSQAKPKVLKQYLKGLTAHLYFRLEEIVEAIWHTPGRIVRAAVARLRQWWARHRKRVLWAAVILLGLVALGGVLVLVGWRRDAVDDLWQRAGERITALYQILSRRLRLFRRERVMVVPQQAEIVPAEPVLDQKLR